MQPNWRKASPAKPNVRPFLSMQAPSPPAPNFQCPRSLARSCSPFPLVLRLALGNLLPKAEPLLAELLWQIVPLRLRTLCHAPGIVPIRSMPLPQSLPRLQLR